MARTAHQTSPEPRPTKAQREALIDAIDHGRDLIRVDATASAQRMRDTMNANGWIAKGRVTPAGYQAIGRSHPEASTS